MGDVPFLQVKPEERQIIDGILNRLLRGHEVWAFGSRIKGKAKPFSDLDLVIVSDQPISIGLLAEVKEAFDESALPWKVDIIDWATTTEAFRDIIKSNKLVIKAGHDQPL